MSAECQRFSSWRCLSRASLRAPFHVCIGQRKASSILLATLSCPSFRISAPTSSQGEATSTRNHPMIVATVSPASPTERNTKSKRIGDANPINSHANHRIDSPSTREVPRRAFRQRRASRQGSRAADAERYLWRSASENRLHDVDRFACSEEEGGGSVASHEVGCGASSQRLQAPRSGRICSRDGMDDQARRRRDDQRPHAFPAFSRSAFWAVPRARSNAARR